MSKRPKCDILDWNEWSCIVRDIKAFGRAMPVGAQGCFAQAAAENEQFKRNAERVLEALDRLGSLPCDTE